MQPFSDNQEATIHRVTDETVMLFQPRTAQPCSPSLTAACGRLLAGWIVCAGCLLLIGQTAGCASYHLGSQYLYRSDIRTVHVMPFESNSFRRYLGQRLTEAVIKEVELNTPLTITDPQIADSFIRGRLATENKRVAGLNINDEPRTLEIVWVVEVDWVDRAGVPLMQMQKVSFNRNAEFVPEGGQSMGTAQQRVIEQVARDVVSQMQMPW